MKKKKRKCCGFFLLRVKWKFHHPYEGVRRIMGVQKENHIISTTQTKIYLTRKVCYIGNFAPAMIFYSSQEKC